MFQNAHLFLYTQDDRKILQLTSCNGIWICILYILPSYIWPPIYLDSPIQSSAPRKKGPLQTSYKWISSSPSSSVAPSSSSSPNFLFPHSCAGCTQINLTLHDCMLQRSDRICTEEHCIELFSRLWTYGSLISFQFCLVWFSRKY